MCISDDCKMAVNLPSKVRSRGDPEVNPGIRSSQNFLHRPSHVYMPLDML